MITHRQSALAIQRGRRFHKALKALTAAGAVTSEQLQAIAIEHKIDKYVPEGYIIAGYLTVYELPAPATEPEEVLMMQSGKSYLAYWKREPDDEMSYFAVLTTGFNERVNAFCRFMESCNLPPYTHCHRCSLPFPSRLGKKYCSDNCRASHHHQSKKQKAKEPTITERVVSLLKDVRDFVRSL